jgi:two-component system sensor histidine kinase DctS
MQTSQHNPTATTEFSSRQQIWRWLIPLLLTLFFLSTVIWLPWQAQHMESTERQEQLIADTLWVEQTIRFQLGRNEDSIRVVANEIASKSLSKGKFQARVTPLLRNSREITRIVWLDQRNQIIASTDNATTSIADFSQASQLTEKQARNSKTALYSHPAKAPGSAKLLLMDYHMPILANRQVTGSLIVSYSTATLLEDMVPWWFAQENEISLIDSDENVLETRAAGGPGHGIYTHSHALDLPGVMLTLRTNSVKNAPRLLRSMLVGSVVLLSIGLVWSLWALWRDINRRIEVENALREQVAFRSAMENSLMTGLRARDLNGRITYVNPAFCQMVGLPAEELIGKTPPMAYWTPESADEFQERFSKVIAGKAEPQFEAIFQRSDGERFPVLIFESPLVDETGKHTGWMGSILDISDRKKIETLNRQQQEKLQASARLATMGEIASTLAHELNQPLAAISSYATGALNLLNSETTQNGRLDLTMLKTALEKASAQAQRAGQIVRSVHTFVKKRDPLRERVTVQALIDSIVPLVELQAQPLFVAVKIYISPHLPSVLGDRVLLEQVLLNLTRNAIESMRDTPSARRVLRIVAHTDDTVSPPNIVMSIIDQGHGIPAEIAGRLFSPFFSTKAEGMGMGLNICRTAIEFHGGTLTHEDNPQGGTIFRFALPSLA